MCRRLTWCLMPDEAAPRGIEGEAELEQRAERIVVGGVDVADVFQTGARLHFAERIRQRLNLERQVHEIQRDAVAGLGVARRRQIVRQCDRLLASIESVDADPRLEI